MMALGHPVTDDAGSTRSYVQAMSTQPGTHRSQSIRAYRGAGAVLAVTMWLTSGCGESQTPTANAQQAQSSSVQAEKTALTLPQGATGKPWQRGTCTASDKRADLLACVDGVPITRADYDRVWPEYPAQTSPAEIVKALVNAEVVAAVAHQQGLWSAWLAGEYRRTLASIYVERKFEREYGWQQVTDKDLKLAWRDWRFRIRYVREPTFFATDAQFLCCSGDPRTCGMRADVATCIDGYTEQAQSLYEDLIADPPRSPDEMRGKVLALGHKYPRAVIADVNFYYRPDVAHEAQVGQGYDLMVEPYAKAVVALKPGEISKPIRTPFGWHISRLKNTEPSRTAQLTDPDVRKDIGEHILPMVRKRDLQRHAFELMNKAGVKITFDQRAGDG